MVLFGGAAHRAGIAIMDAIAFITPIQIVKAIRTTKGFFQENLLEFSMAKLLLIKLLKKLMLFNKIITFCWIINPQ